MNRHAALDRYAELFENITRDDVARLGDYFADNARFKDPFNDIRGLPAIRHVFTRMFDTCLDIDFHVAERLLTGDTGILLWTMRFRPDVAGFRKQAWEIHGVSRVQFDNEGKVIEHVDYWDSGEYFYARLPVIGAIIRFIRKRVG
jgi:steroid delta-isomerase